MEQQKRITKSISITGKNVEAYTQLEKDYGKIKTSKLFAFALDQLAGNLKDGSNSKGWEFIRLTQ